MANIPEVPVYPAGVRQHEVTDAVKGGPIDEGGDANKPIKDLADRTAYLREQADPAQAMAAVLSIHTLW